MNTGIYVNHPSSQVCPGTWEDRQEGRKTDGKVNTYRRIAVESQLAYQLEK